MTLLFECLLPCEISLKYSSSTKMRSHLGTSMSLGAASAFAKCYAPVVLLLLPLRLLEVFSSLNFC